MRRLNVLFLLSIAMFAIIFVLLFKCHCGLSRVNSETKLDIPKCRVAIILNKMWTRCEMRTMNARIYFIDLNFSQPEKNFRLVGFIFLSLELSWKRLSDNLCFMSLIYWWYILQVNKYHHNFRLRCFFRLLWICSVYDSSKLPILYPSVVSQRSFVPFCIFPIVIWKYDSPLECSVIFANPWVSIISFVWVSIIETP